MDPVTIITISVVATVVSYFGYKAVEQTVKAPTDTIEAAGKTFESLMRTGVEEFKKLFGATPRLSIDKIVIQQAPTAICELCLAKMEIEASAKIESKWWGSTKCFKASQTYIIKAGYDLNRLKFDCDSNKKSLRVTICDATVVNTIPEGDIKTTNDEGWWNRISDNDRNTVMNSLPEKAKQTAMSSRICDKANEQLEVVLNRLFGKFVSTIEIIRQDDTVLFDDKNRLREIPSQSMKKLGLVES